MSDDDQTRDEIERIVNDEPVQEPVQEEEIKPVKAKPKAKAKPKTKVTKAPVEPIKGEEVIEEEPEPVIKEGKSKNNYKLKEMVNCPDCNLSMTQRALIYSQKEIIVKGHFKKKLTKKLKKM